MRSYLNSFELIKRQKQMPLHFLINFWLFLFLFFFDMQNNRKQNHSPKSIRIRDLHSTAIHTIGRNRHVVKRNRMWNRPRPQPRSKNRTPSRHRRTFVRPTRTAGGGRYNWKICVETLELVDNQRNRHLDYLHRIVSRPKAHIILTWPTRNLRRTKPNEKPSKVTPILIRPICVRARSISHGPTCFWTPKSTGHRLDRFWWPTRSEPLACCHPWVRPKWPNRSTRRLVRFHPSPVLLHDLSTKVHWNPTKFVIHQNLVNRSMHVPTRWSTDQGWPHPDLLLFIMCFHHIHHHPPLPYRYLR